MKKIFQVIKSSENNIIMSLKDDKDSYILKIAQRGNASLQREYETLLRLKKFSKIFKIGTYGYSKIISLFVVVIEVIKPGLDNVNQSSSLYTKFWGKLLVRSSMKIKYII